MVKVYLVQHGKAKREEEDPKRRLTDMGVAETNKIGEHLRKMRIKVGKIVHSGKDRARMTAEILANHLNINKIIGAEGLNPLDNPSPWVERLNHIDEDIMIVGHLPHLSRLTSGLLGTGGVEVVKFRYSAVLCLEKDDKWRIIWYITPETT